MPAIVSSITLSAQLDGAAVASAAGALADASVVLCQLEAPPSCALAAFALAREAGARTVLNPAPAVPLDPALLALTDVLVPNEHEAAVLAGVDEPPAALAAALARLHPAIAVIVTAGSAGCFLAEPGGPVEHLPAPSVERRRHDGRGRRLRGCARGTPARRGRVPRGGGVRDPSGSAVGDATRNDAGIRLARRVGRPGRVRDQVGVDSRTTCGVDAEEHDGERQDGAKDGHHRDARRGRGSVGGDGGKLGVGRHEGREPVCPLRQHHADRLVRR